MKRILTLPVFCLISVLFFSSCVKDKLTRTYTIYTPVYKTRAEVAANIKTNPSREIGQAGKFFLYGRYILVNELDKGIHIIDNSKPATPKKIGFIDIPGNVDLAVKNNILYADLYSDLVTIDISDPANAKLKKVVRNAFPQRRYVGNMGFVTDTNRVIVEWAKKDTTVDVKENIGRIMCGNCNVLQFASLDAAGSKAYSPVAIAGSMARFSIVRNYLYTVDNTDLNAFSLADPEEPVFSKKVPIGWGIETIYPFKDKLFIGSNTGMFIFDITNGSTPQKVGEFSHARVCDPVIAEQDYAYVTLRSGTTCANRTFTNQLDVVNITNVSQPYLMKSYPLTNPHGLSKDGNLLFIGEGQEGLKVFDATDVMNIKLLKHIKGFDGFDVIAYNKIAMVVGKSGIRQFDYSNADDIRYLSTISW
jgi:hypothetical protein